MSGGNHNASEMTVIGPDTTIKGEMNFDGGARVLGTFEGKITAGGNLEIGESATCRAELNGARVEIDGHVEGDVSATDRLTLNAAARVHGDITAGTLIVKEGASYVGRCNVGPEAAALAGEAHEPKANDRAKPAAKAKADKPAAHASLTPPWRAGESDDDAPLVETTASAGALASNGRLGGE